MATYYWAISKKDNKSSLHIHGPFKSKKEASDFINRHFRNWNRTGIYGAESFPDFLRQILEQEKDLQIFEALNLFEWVFVPGVLRVLKSVGFKRARNEFSSAIQHLSQGNASDALKSIYAGLESVIKKVTGKKGKKTWENLTKALPDNICSPIKEALEKIGGYISDRARHGEEGKDVDILEAHFIVGLFIVVAMYIIELTHLTYQT